MKHPQNGSPFPQIPAKVYAYLKAQVPDSLSDAPADIGRDATEEIYLAYFKDNHGLSLHPYGDRDPRTQIVRQHAAAKEGRRRHRVAEQEAEATALEDAAAALPATAGLDAHAIRTYWAAQNGGCEDLVLLTHLAAAGLRLRALFEGPPGLGKSRATVEALDALRLPDQGHVKVVAGHLTPLAGYQLLYEYRDPTALLVFDESTPVVRSPDLHALLKDALFLGEVAWTSTKALPDNLPGSFRYAGNVVLNANSFGTTPDASALRDRLVCLKLVLTKQQVLAKMTTPPPRDARLDAALRSRVVSLRSGRTAWPVLAEADVAYAATVLEAATRDWPPYAPLSFRHLQKSLTLLQGVKGLFGWTPHARDWYEAIVRHSLDAAQPTTFIVKAIQQAGGRLKTTDLRDLIMAHYGLRQSAAYDRLAALKDAGVIEDDGHRTTILTH